MTTSEEGPPSGGTSPGSPTPPPPPYQGPPPPGAPPPMVVPQRSVEWWKRLVAFLIDSIITGGIGFIIGAGVGIALYSGEPVPTTEEQAQVNNLLSLVASALSVLYFTLMEGRDRGQTLGKMALQIRVVHEGTGRSIGYRRALARSLLRFVSALPCFLGYFWALWDPKGQAWHDKIVDTLVVPTDRDVARPPAAYLPR